MSACFCVYGRILSAENQLIYFSGTKPTFYNTTCIPESEMTSKSCLCCKHVHNPFLLGYFPCHELASPQMTKESGVCEFVFEATAVMNCRLFHSWCFHFTPLVTDKCFPTVPTYRQLQASRTQTHTRSLTLRHTWQRQILLDASIKRKSLCFVSTVAVVQPNSRILSSSISHGCEIREMETAFAAQSKKIFKVSSWGF